jgi:hypothetical protein
MITEVTPIEELKDMYEELFLASTNAVTKIAPASVVNAHAYGTAKLGQKILKELATVEGNIFPNVSFGTHLDNIALLRGLPERFGALESTTYVRLHATAGTTYVAGVVQFKGKHGLIFNLEANVTIGSIGFGYAKVRSVAQGDDTLVDPLSLNEIINPPVGHEYVINEYRAQNGQSAEVDDLFRRRIIEGANILASGTLSKYEQVFMKINPRVLRIYNGGMNFFGQYVIYVSSVNGVDFTSSEFLSITNEANQYLSLSEQASGIELKNIDYIPIDVSMRIQIDNTATNDDLRRNMQINMQKYVDWRFWEFGQQIEWDDLLEIAKRTKGVDYVLDNYFVPNVDVPTGTLELPRIRSFTIYDVDGVIISSDTGNLNPAFFPNQPDFIAQQTLFANTP